jgi:hypothetical protein
MHRYTHGSHAHFGRCGVPGVRMNVRSSNSARASGASAMHRMPRMNGYLRVAVAPRAPAGQASCTHVPHARLRASCAGVIGRPQWSQHCPAARAELPSQPAGARPARPSPAGSEPVTGNPKPPGQKCRRCAWTTRSPIGERSRRPERKPGPARLTRRMTPRPPRHSSGCQPPRSWRLRSVTVILPAEAGTPYTWWTQDRQTVNQRPSRSGRAMRRPVSSPGAFDELVFGPVGVVAEEHNGRLGKSLGRGVESTPVRS